MHKSPFTLNFLTHIAVGLLLIRCSMIYPQCPRLVPRPSFPFGGWGEGKGDGAWYTQSAHAPNFQEILGIWILP